MNELDLITTLQDCVESDTKPSFRLKIAQLALETDNPVEHLFNMYKDNYLIYTMDDFFFLDNIQEIIMTLPTIQTWHIEALTIGNVRNKLSFLCFQACLENLLIEYEIIKESERFFTQVES